MTMKLLFKHITSLLRTVLLLGVVALFNILPTQAQEIPDAFETVDPADILADNTLLNDYYYIQFYIKKDDALNTYEYFYLADRGDGNPLRTKDFIPFAKNIQWKLVKTGDNQYKLQSGENNYVYFDYSTSVNLFKCTSNSSDASILTYRKRSDGGYEIMLTDVPSGITNPERTCMQNNNGGNGWAQVSRMNKDNARVCLRFAKLKTTNVAYIIFYQDPTYDSKGNYVDGNSETYNGRDWFTQRHYLTYSGTGAEDWASVITNGNLSGSDVSCFYKKEQGIDTGSPVSATIVDGVGRMGSRGFVIQSSADATQDWDTQFFVRSNETFSVGTVVHLEFDCKASKSAAVSIQGHNEPGDYVNNDGGGDVNFTEQWQHIERDIPITDASVRTFAFNLSKERSAVKYYIDNIVLSIQPDRFEDSDVSSRSSIMKTYNNWIIPTTANYHKDGLWVLEETSAGSGHFNIKKYGTSDYVKTTGTTAGPLRYTLNPSNPSIEFVLGDANANRFTVVQNVGTNNYMNYAGVQRAGGRQYDYDADGWYVLDYGNANNTWKAGFLPVEVPAQDEFYRVLLGVKRDRRTDSRIKLTRESDSQGSVTVEPLSGSTMTDLYGATFTVTSSNPTNVFQKKNLPKGCYDGITIEFGSAIPAGYYIHTYGGQQNYSPLDAGITSYTIDLSSSGSVIDDFTIFTLGVPSGPITISACYFTSGGQQVAEPDCGINEMLNYDGKTSTYSNQAGERILWELEQDGDYQHFRLKTPDGRYYQDMGQMTYDASEATVYTNKSLFEYFDVKWFYLDPALSQKEIDVSDKKVTHKISYLSEYADDYPGLDLSKQGLASDIVSDWKNGDGTQKTNHFEITHYVKKGNRLKVEFPTILNNSGDHNYYQRWYNYGESDDNMDLDNLKNHISLDTEENGTVQYYLYKNGIVTGEKIYWETDLTTLKRHAQRNFYYTNSDGQPFTVAADVSRYSDYTYENPSDPLSRNLEEPSLTMRYLFHMLDAKDMAADLSQNKYKWTTDGDVNEDHWKEKKTIHFPSKQVAYDNDKWVGYRGEFIGLRHVFSDYWVFDGSGTDDANLINAVNDGNASGKIEVKIHDPNGTGIRLGGWNPTLAANHDGTLKYSDTDVYTDAEEDAFEGFYFYDKMYRFVKTQYGDSRFIVFRYPKGSDGKTTEVSVTGKEVYIHVYFKVNETTKYQLAQFTLIFDEDSATLPWTSVNGSNKVQGTDRDPDRLREIAGNPIAKITFDYPYPTNEPDVHTYHYPTKGATLHGQYEYDPSVTPTIANSSPLPLTFDNTNYSFDGDGANWGSYAMVSQKRTTWGNDKLILPADSTGGYTLSADKAMKKAFLYIDASEQPGDICAMDFQGEFCAGDKLICSGWISGSNRYDDDGDYRCPGGITLTVKGERIEDGEKETIYRYCPGQCYELDNGTGVDGSEGADQVVWQQFYFVFGTTKKYKKYWMEVNNNCVSSNGGDFMLDNVEVFALVPEVIPELNTPICVNNEVTNMQLLKINIGFDKILAATNNTEVTEGTGSDQRIAFVFLEKYKFLTTFQTELAKLSPSVVKTIAELETIIETGEWGDMVDTGHPYADAYQTAFNAAVLGDITKVWDSNDRENNTDSGILNFHWSTKFSDMQSYSFAKAVNRSGAVFRETDLETDERFIVMNGNYPNKLEWQVNTDYYIVPFSNAGISFTDLYDDFNIFSVCSKKRVFQIKPSLNILSLETFDETRELEVCEGKIPTLLADLTGYDINGNLVPMKDLNFDWWLGDKTTDPDHPVLATLYNYHHQHKVITYKDKNNVTHNDDVYLDVALSTLRAYYKDATDLNGIIQKLDETPNLTRGMTLYLQELVEKGQLVLHQKSISIPAEKSSDDDPYFYLVACPIHDDKFDQSLLYVDNSGSTPEDVYVAHYCDEPQGLRMKIGERAPTLKCGFVPGENGFTSYDYSTVNDAILSIRLAKTAQFKTVQHGDEDEEPVEPSTLNAETTHYLWIPIRNAETETASGVIRKSADYDVYLASTNDPTWDKKIYTAMSKAVPSLPVVGKIVQLTAINTKGGENLNSQNDANRLCIYFTENFEVREGYNYTLSLPFQEEGNVNACDGTMLINMKIVPDYEVWTGAAGNTDWNNDENWRRADYDELYADNGTTLKDEGGTLQEYKTNNWNYRTHKDRLFRKGFAPLYCTHVLIMSNEWGNAPVLYDALDGAGSLSASPFPNLRDKDNWDGEGAEATATSILKFDLQARKYDDWNDTYGAAANKGRAGDLLAEMYQINSCDEIAFQPATELRNAHLLNYNNAWVEYKLKMARWYLLGSPLQGTIAGEWYAPTGNAQQQTTYFENVTFGDDYDRYSPAIYQRSWDKAKTVLYEMESVYSTEDNPDDDDPQLLDNNGALPGYTQQGTWDDGTWNVTGADAYLDRLGYKPMGDKKVNVAIKGIWSNTYNDATVDYTKGGFSVMVLNNLKGGSNDDPAIIRLPKEDVSYKYWTFDKDKSGTNTDLSDIQNPDGLNRARNRGRLKTDLLLPVSAQKLEKEASSYKYGDQRKFTRVPIKAADLTTMIAGIRTHQESVSAGISNMGYYLVENPFPCGLDMNAFFATNTGLEKRYWLLTETGQHLVQYAEESNEWITQSGGNFTTAEAVVTPGQGFFVEATTPGDATTITFNKNMQAQSRYGVKDSGTDVTIVVGTRQPMKTITQTADDGTQVQVEVPDTDAEPQEITEKVTVYKYVQTSDDDLKYELQARTRGEETNLMGLVITAERDGNQTSALVMQREGASNDFLPTEDTETFITSDLEQVPTVYTLCGRLATTINSIHDFRSLPLGVESNSDAPCTLTFKGVELLGDSISFYDAVEQKLTPLKSGMTISVSGQTQNRYYLVRSLIQEEAAAETHLQIFTEGLTAKVIASTAEPITSVRCYDTAGRLIHSATPQTPEYSFSLPIAGIYIINAETENDRKTVKLMAK